MTVPAFVTTSRAVHALLADTRRLHTTGLVLPKASAQLVASHTQNKKGGEQIYRVYKVFVPHISAWAFWLEGCARRASNSGHPPGPQNYMQSDAMQRNHEVWAALDVPGASKVFVSYANDRAFFDALFNPDPAVRKRPSNVFNTSYEIVREGSACWPHFDIEWDPAVHTVVVANASQLVLLFEDLVLEALRRHYPFKCAHLNRSHFRVSRSRNPGAKCSYHLVLRGGVAFPDSSTHHHAFVQRFFRELVIALVLDKDERLRPLFFDRSKINVKVGGGCIMDTQIYTRNREFRPCGAVKLSAPDRVLVAYDLETEQELFSPDSMSYDQWHEYLVGNVPPLASLTDMQLLRATETTLALSSKSKVPPVSVKSAEQEALTCLFVPGRTRSTTDQQLRDDSVAGAGAGAGAAAAASGSISTSSRKQVNSSTLLESPRKRRAIIIMTSSSSSSSSSNSISSDFDVASGSSCGSTSSNSNNSSSSSMGEGVRSRLANLLRASGSQY